jgi:hypothetical protein
VRLQWEQSVARACTAKHTHLTSSQIDLRRLGVLRTFPCCGQRLDTSGRISARRRLQLVSAWRSRPAVRRRSAATLLDRRWRRSMGLSSLRFLGRADDSLLHLCYPSMCCAIEFCSPYCAMALLVTICAFRCEGGFCIRSWPWL